MTEQEALVSQVLGDFVPIDGVPPNFVDFVHENIARRPSPTPSSDPLQAIVDKLDEILTLLRGTPE